MYHVEIVDEYGLIVDIPLYDIDKSVCEKWAEEHKNEYCNSQVNVYGVEYTFVPN